MSQGLPDCVVAVPLSGNRDCIIHEYLNESGLYSKMESLKNEIKELTLNNSKLARDLASSKSKISQLEVCLHAT